MYIFITEIVRLCITDKLNQYAKHLSQR